MKNTIILLMLLISTTMFSQEKKEQTFKERLEVRALANREELVKNRFTETFEMSELFWKYMSFDFRKAMKSASEMTIFPLEIDKEKTIQLLESQKNMIKWYKFRQRRFYRKQIRKVKRL